MYKKHHLQMISTKPKHPKCCKGFKVGVGLQANLAKFGRNKH